jgi:uncharacterized membrane protein
MREEPGKEDLEPLDTAESFFRAVRKESDLTSGARIAMLLVVALGVLGLLGAVGEAAFGGGPNADIAGGAFGAIVLSVVVALFILVFAVDGAYRGVRSGVRKLSHRRRL